VFERFGVHWTPTLMVLDPDGTVRYKFEGYLPAEDFLARLELGLAHAAFARKQWNEAERGFRRIVNDRPKAESAPEALYWAGVAKYKASGDAAALAETARLLKEKHPQNAWTTKASVWSK
jgi:TolA-binding protein